MTRGYFDKPAIEPVPKTIVQAICQVQSGLTGAVQKSRKNEHGRYMFASTDDIYAALCKLMAAAGLVCIGLEAEPPEIVRVESNGKTQQWAKMRFQYVLATSEATWADPRSQRSLFIQILGPQTFQAAQSYAEKAFLRSVFKLATGDMDLDESDQPDAPRARKKSSAQSKRDGTDQKFNELIKMIESTNTEDELRELRVATGSDIADWPNKWSELVHDQFDLRMEQIGGTWV